MRIIYAILYCAIFPYCSAEEITGPVRVIDGDSIRIGKEEIRINGIDAFEGKQLCRLKDSDWPCGKIASEYLRDYVGDSSIRCTWKERDQYQRALGHCFKDKKDIAAEMVRNGYALAYRKYSDRYIGEEINAKAGRLGVWAGEIVPPWEWRRGKRLAGNELPGIDCPVKGNVNRKGRRIYHVKGWRDHAKVRINKNEGDRCFQTAEEATAAGFRPAQK